MILHVRSVVSHQDDVLMVVNLQVLLSTKVREDNGPSQERPDVDELRGRTQLGAKEGDERPAACEFLESLDGRWPDLR